MNRRKFIGTAAAAGAVISVSKRRSAMAQTAKTRKAAQKKSKVQTDKAPKPVGPYSQAIIAGNTIYVAGQGPIDPKTGRIEVTGIEAQAKQTFENIKAIVEAAGSSMANVVKVNIYLADLKDFSKMNEIYRQYFPADYPARATVGAQLLLGMLIEVDCVAVK
ncbi:MAG: Rid family detoxifying hydrolase [Acidobacteriota bacterium]